MCDAAFERRVRRTALPALAPLHRPHPLHRPRPIAPTRIPLHHPHVRSPDRNSVSHPPRHLLHHLSQPTHEDGRSGARHDEPRGRLRACRRLGRSGAEAAWRADAAGRRPTAAAGGGRHLRAFARARARSGGAGESQSRPRGAPSSESRGVRQRDRGSARRACRCRGAAAEGRRSRRLRQRRQRADGLALVPGAIHLRGARRDEHGARQPGTARGQHDLPARARHRSDAARRRTAARHARRTDRRPPVPGGRRVQDQHQRPRRRRLRPRHGVRAHARGHARRREGVPGAHRRRRGPEGDRPAAGGGGRRHQRTLPEHSADGHRRTAHGSA